MSASWSEGDSPRLLAPRFPREISPEGLTLQSQACSVTPMNTTQSPITYVSAVAVNVRPETLAPETLAAALVSKETIGIEELTDAQERHYGFRYAFRVVAS